MVTLSCELEDEYVVSQNKAAEIILFVTSFQSLQFRSCSRDTTYESVYECKWNHNTLRRCTVQSKAYCENKGPTFISNYQCQTTRRLLTECFLCYRWVTTARTVLFLCVTHLCKLSLCRGTPNRYECNCNVRFHNN